MTQHAPTERMAPTQKKRPVVVESPTKAKTIRGFLPDGYVVAASMGHVRDLPESAAEIPASVKGKDWARLGVDVEHDFEPLYVVPASKRKVVSELKAMLRGADGLGSDLVEDDARNGNARLQHLHQVPADALPLAVLVGGDHQLVHAAEHRL